MNILELFAGSRSIGKVAEARGHNVFSVDINDFEGISLVKDIALLDMSDVPFIPDVVWSGTPCTTFSLAAIRHHRNMDYSPKSEFAFKCDRMNIKVNSFINEWLKINPDMLYYIENPRGVLSKMYYMEGIPRTMITYCSYGDVANKPTNIFSNNLWNPLFNPLGWRGKPMCPRYKYDKEGNVINQHCHHEPSMRGSRVRELQKKGFDVKKGGTEAKKGNYERSIYPPELCEEIIIASENKINLKVNYEAL